MAKHSLKSVLELPGEGSVVLGLLHDFADEPLLAVEVVEVELVVQLLEHGDPLDHVHAVEVIAILGRPVFSNRISLINMQDNQQIRYLYSPSTICIFCF